MPASYLRLDGQCTIVCYLRTLHTYVPIFTSSPRPQHELLLSSQKNCLPYHRNALGNAPVTSDINHVRALAHVRLRLVVCRIVVRVQKRAAFVPS